MLIYGWEGGRSPDLPDRPQHLPLELSEVYIIKAVLARVPEHWKSITEKPNGSFFI